MTSLVAMVGRLPVALSSAIGAQTPAYSHFMSRARWRQFLGTYLALFFLAAAAAPHRHLNAVEDMLLDQPSNTGFVVLTDPAAGRDSLPTLQPLRLVPDISCMACFTRDFVSSFAATVAFAPFLAKLPERPKLLPSLLRTTLPADASSRAPPLAS